MPAFTPVRSIFRSVALSTVDTSTFSGDGAYFRVLNRGISDLWVRVDGTDPAANADGSKLVRVEENRTFPDPSGNREIRVTAGLAACSYGIELE